MSSFSISSIRRPSTIWNLWLLLCWCIWWGGLSFYAIVVVPIGTENLGSVAQGFVTQKVTAWHNGITALFVLCLGCEAWRRRCRKIALSATLLALVTAALVYWHLYLTGLMDFEQRTVPESFYNRHAIYLWITAVEWGCGLLLPLWLFQTHTASQEEASTF